VLCACARLSLLPQGFQRLSVFKRLLNVYRTDNRGGRSYLCSGGPVSPLGAPIGKSNSCLDFGVPNSHLRFTCDFFRAAAGLSGLLRGPKPGRPAPGRSSQGRSARQGQAPVWPLRGSLVNPCRKAPRCLLCRVPSRINPLESPPHSIA
jgi:hypothetical protein